MRDHGKRFPVSFRFAPDMIQRIEKTKKRTTSLFLSGKDVL